MEAPKITPWNEKNINTPEEFIVFKPVRIDTGEGKGARPFMKGAKVKVTGFVKKDLYFQNKIMYPKDYEAVTAYEKAAGKFDVKPSASKESAAESQNLLKRNNH